MREVLDRWYPASVLGLQDESFEESPKRRSRHIKSITCHPSRYIYAVVRNRVLPQGKYGLIVYTADYRSSRVFEIQPSEGSFRPLSRLFKWAESFEHYVQ